jgi:hypothetical protein
MSRPRLRLQLLLLFASAAGVIAALVLADFVRRDRKFFLDAVRAWRDVGLSLYSENPDLQIGPAVVWLLALGDSWLGEAFLVTLLILLMVLWPAIALWALYVSRREGHAVDAGDIALVVLGAFTWVDLCMWAHIDDAHATLLLLGALTVRGRPGWQGALVGLAAACKPWAVVGIAMAPRRPWSFLVALVGVLAAFALPFVIAEPGTLTASGGFAGYIHPGSLWRLVGFEVNQQPPPGFRVVELLGLAGLAWWLGRRVGPAQAIMAVLAVRIALEPGTHSYYVAPVVVMLLASGLNKNRRLVAGAAALTLWLASNTDADISVAFVRLVACFVLALVTIAPHRGLAVSNGPSQPTAVSESN